MKYSILCALLCLSSLLANTQAPGHLQDTTLLQPVELVAIKATDKMPVASTNYSKQEIREKNIGQDLPFILQQAPGVQVNSDAGNGIGYTGIRVRGSDASRINVTINGIPYNDAESQGTFFVDMPDFASSAASIQVQRGVGTSTNGAGAFGGSINISTNETDTKKSLEFNNGGGSFHSFRNTLMANSGLFGKHFIVNARLSSIRSDGYIDRASSRLKAFFSSMQYLNKKSSLRLNIFSGKEKTYQAWYGIDEETLKNNRRYNAAGTEKPGEPYDNETDNYTQTHYQLFYNQQWGNYWKSNLAVFLTRGKGYYEQYKAGATLEDYSLPTYISNNDTVYTTDLVRRLWLDNYFYGTVFSFQYNKKKTTIIIGGNVNRYDGGHYGTIPSAIVQVAVPAHYKWYDLDATKTDAAIFAKWTQQFKQHWYSFIDLQARQVNYRINGFRNSPSIRMKNDYFFFNPKAGITYRTEKSRYYISYAMAAKEPNRDDFETGIAQVPKPEKLHDIEAGYERTYTSWNWSINLYYMNYRDQLVLTGNINDVGAYTRTNIPRSYRAGLEIQGAYTFNKWLSANGNIALSRNKVRRFTEFIDDYDNGGQQTKFYEEPDIAFSPSVISGMTIRIKPLKNTEALLLSKYVSKQYLDNTSNDSRKLDGYHTQDIKITYSKQYASKATISFFVQANNIFSKEYEPNGYTFSYIYGGSLNTENYYFPMATFNMMAGIGIRL